MKNQEFNGWYDSVPNANVSEVRKKILERTKITADVFRNWRNNRTAIPELAKPIINEIAGKQVFSV